MYLNFKYRKKKKSLHPFHVARHKYKNFRQPLYLTNFKKQTHFLKTLKIYKRKMNEVSYFLLGINKKTTPHK